MPTSTGVVVVSTCLDHETGSRPVNGALPNSVSATPSPSLPGSQDSTIASASPWIDAMFIGRPDTTSTTHFIAAQTLSAAALSAALRSSVWPLPTSPTPSAYGVSPTTTTPTS